MRKGPEKITSILKFKDQQQSQERPFNLNDYVTNGISKQDVVEFKTAFDMFDHTGNGKVEISELKEAFINLGFHHQSIFTESVLAHLEKKGPEIDFGEFIRIATARINEDYLKPETSLVFSAFDPKGTGKFSIYDLKDTIQAVGEDMTEEEMEKIFRAADFDGDGYVTHEDFYNIITKRVMK